jgi:hypothetical protein
VRELTRAHDVLLIPDEVMTFHLGAQLLPRWLSVWGLIGALLYLAEPLSALAGSELEILYGLLFLHELVMTVWLIVKGFNRAAMAPEPARRRRAG